MSLPKSHSLKVKGVKVICWIIVNDQQTFFLDGELGGLHILQSNLSPLMGLETRRHWLFSDFKAYHEGQDPGVGTTHLLHRGISRFALYWR